MKRLQTLLLVGPAWVAIHGPAPLEVLAQQPNAINVACYTEHNIPSPCPNPQNPNDNNTGNNQPQGRSLWQKQDASQSGYW